MTTTTDIKRQSEAPSAASEKPKQQTYGLDHKRLIAVHRNYNCGWKWASASKIKDQYGITSNVLNNFHALYGLPRLSHSNNQNSFFSMPALEVILETVPEMHN